MELEIQLSLDEIQKIAANKERKREKDTNFTVQHTRIYPSSHFLPILNKFYSVDFYSDLKCCGCGTCERYVYLRKLRSSKITLCGIKMYLVSTVMLV